MTNTNTAGLGEAKSCKIDCCVKGRTTRRATHVQARVHVQVLRLWRFDIVDLQQGVHNGQRSNTSGTICHFLDDRRVKEIGMAHKVERCFAASVCVCVFAFFFFFFFFLACFVHVTSLNPSSDFGLDSRLQGKRTVI